MISKASVTFVRISPRKVRYVIDLIRKKKVSEAQGILIGSPRRAREIVTKLLNQAVDAAVKNSHADAKNLYISHVTADGGPTMRRFRAASMGRASTIAKRTSHIRLELDLIKKNLAAALSAKPTASKPAAKTAPVQKTNKKLAGAK